MTDTEPRDTGARGAAPGDDGLQGSSLGRIDEAAPDVLRAIDLAGRSPIVLAHLVYTCGRPPRHE